VVQAYFWSLLQSEILQTSRCPYEIKDIIHVRDLTLYSVLMKSIDQTDEDYMNWMDWNREWSPSESYDSYLSTYSKSLYYIRETQPFWRKSCG